MNTREIMTELATIRKNKNLSKYQLNKKLTDKKKCHFIDQLERRTIRDRKEARLGIIEKYANLLGYELIIVPMEEK